MKKVLFLILASVYAIFAVAQSSYYSSIDGVKGGAALKNALYTLISDHSRIDYGSGAASTWGAFYETDRNPANNQVYDMYSSEVRYFSSKGATIGGMNIEHSVPKSWWGGGKNNAYCDLHHLNPSDQTANNRKGNYPLAELETVSWENGVTFVGKATIGGSSINAYEPCDEYKGDFARVFMYMFTCYQNLSYEYTWMNYENSTYPTLKPWAVELLLKWHEQDPVSAREIERNNAVHSIQGNRNPYVDYPRLADFVWGDSVNYTFSLAGSGISGEGGSTAPEGTIYYLNEAFSSSLGEFSVVSVDGDYSWQNEYGCAYMSGYEDYANYANECWLVSPSMNFSEAANLKISFDYVTKYNQTGMVAAHNQLLVSRDYTGDVAAATWEVIDFSIVENTTSGDWTYTSTGDVALPEIYAGESNVTIAFKYISTTTRAGTWQVKNLVLSGEKAADDGGDDNTGGDSGDDNTGDGGDTGGEGGSVGNNGNYPFEEFTLVTDAATLTAGDTIIIAYNDIVMGAQSGKYRASLSGAVVAGNKLTSYPEGTQKILLEAGAVAGTFAFNVDGQYLAAASSSSNYLYSVDELSNDGCWLLSIADGVAEIVAQGTYSRNTLQYNTSSPRFSCYTGTQKSVSVYAKSPVASTSIDTIVVEAENSVVDVYNMHGVCVRKAVERSVALDALPRGFYIVLGKKIFKQ